MGSTIYYKGTLRDSVSADELYETIVRQSAAMNCRIVRDGADFYIEFAEGESEPLLFRLKDRKVNWFCKWHNPDHPDEYYRIFELFVAIKPLFKSLRIDDDEGVWQEYLLAIKPCKIRLRGLSGASELSLLERDYTVPYDFTRFMMPGMMFLPYSDVVYAVIARDFLHVFGAAAVDDLVPEHILKLANSLVTEEEGFFTTENLAFYFPFILLSIWINYCLSYRDKGRVCRLSDEVWGLKTNKLAAQHGILSIFLNIHSGNVNYKHAEMKRFAALHIDTGPRSTEYSTQAKTRLSQLIRDYIAENDIDTATVGPVFIPLTGDFKDAYEALISGSKSVPDAQIEDARQSLAALVSVLDYLGFKYVGPEEPDIYYFKCDQTE